MMNNRLITILIILTAGVIHTFGQDVDATGRFGIKAKADIGLGSSYAIKYSLPTVSDRSTQNRFGLEFSYIFWHSGKNSIEAATGIEIGLNSYSSDFANFTYNYAAGQSADQDGDTYIRHSSIDDAGLSLNTMGIIVPVYIQYNFNLHKKWDLYAKTGMMIDLNIKSNSKYKSGTVTSFGIYPQYDNLMIDDEWLNDFGTRNLSSIAVTHNPKFRTSFVWLIGIGARFHISRNFSLTAGVNYNYGLSNCIQTGESLIRDGDITEPDAIVTYNVDNGLKGKPLNDAMEKCKLNRLGLELGLEYRF